MYLAVTRLEFGLSEHFGYETPVSVFFIRAVSTYYLFVVGTRTLCTVYGRRTALFHGCNCRYLTVGSADIKMVNGALSP